MLFNEACVFFYSLNTPPGTKLLLKSGSIPMSHGIILLRPSHISQLLGGRVSSLVEKWELNKVNRYFLIIPIILIIFISTSKKNIH